jgi:TetR/AcrR family transcriptional repressor of nem operon
MIGNFTAEVADQSEPLRRRLVEIFAEIRSGIAKALQAAVDAGEVSRDLDVAAVTDLILSGLQGSTLVAKAERDRAVMDRFKQLLFTTILR